MGNIIVKTVHGSFETESLAKKYVDKKDWQPADPKAVCSFIPGTIEELRVNVGDKVEKGDSLMLFKAMKMDNNILSEQSGVIKSINVTIGQNVSKGYAMIIFE
ncbi:MAG: acetyl-CoA carboxylase biotin carboxyl carrier protein subunit [Bacteroidetes bacterium]|nr:acetyl-CoA carboxylase biotin carboxyl carrier protein subunit [Bacteroidota bacterium]